MTPGPRTARRILALVVATVALQSALIGFASAQLAPPSPTPVPPDGSLSPFPQSLDTPADPTIVPDVSAASAILADLTSGQVLYAKDPRSRRSIASLTKIMTALLTLERRDPSDVVTVEPDAIFQDPGGIAVLGLEAGEEIAVGHLLDALMLQSANDAAIALAHDVSGSVDRFVRLMNRRARRLGMLRTDLRSPNGLDDRGTSTAQDVMILTRAAYRTDGFAPIVAQLDASVPAPDGSTRELQNRNALLWLYPGTIGVKTGYTSAAGFCVVAVAERDGRQLVAVVLGAPGDAFSDAASLLDHGFAAFVEHTFIEAGTPVGVVSLAGGAVPVETGARLDALVARSSLEHVRQRVSVDPSAAYPPAPGERVATLSIRVPGLEVGSVPLVVSSVPPPPPEPEGSWWSRTCPRSAAPSGRRSTLSSAEQVDRACYPRARMTEVATVLFGREDIRRRVEELGRSITGDYAGRAPVLISVLKGGVVFLADLIRQIRLPLEVHLIAISRYGEAEESLGRVRILLDLEVDVSGRDVILVEDIVDTGLTLSYLLSVLRARGPASLEVCTLLDKSVRRIVPLAVRYSGFDCPDRFVVGYGLDVAERFRNLPDILAVDDARAVHDDPTLLEPLLTSGA